MNIMQFLAIIDKRAESFTSSVYLKITIFQQMIDGYFYRLTDRNKSICFFNFLPNVLDWNSIIDRESSEGKQ